MELDDIDWRTELTVRGKGRRRERLPLPADVGEVLAAYAQRRPPSGSRRLFLRSVAPFVGFADTGALRGVLERACARAGLPYVSPHRRRHTTAAEMLRAGAALAEIAQVVRHRSSATTAVYARVDYAQLRMLARPWPRSGSALVRPAGSPVSISACRTHSRTAVSVRSKSRATSPGPRP